MIYEIDIQKLQKKPTDGIQLLCIQEAIKCVPGGAALGIYGSQVLISELAGGQSA
jgi:hypothetical protein